eukprot:6569681-Prymnesium_polylepis.1
MAGCALMGIARAQRAGAERSARSQRAPAAARVMVHAAETAIALCATVTTAFLGRNARAWPPCARMAALDTACAVWMGGAGATRAFLEHHAAAPHRIRACPAAPATDAVPGTEAAFATRALPVTTAPSAWCRLAARAGVQAVASAGLMEAASASRAAPGAAGP